MWKSKGSLSFYPILPTNVHDNCMVSNYISTFDACYVPWYIACDDFVRCIEVSSTCSIQNAIPTKIYSEIFWIFGVKKEHISIPTHQLEMR